MSSDILSTVLTIVRVLVQIAFLSLLFYWVMRILRRTPGLTQLVYAIGSLALLYALVSYFDLPVLRWFIEKILTFLPVILVILFKEEIRRIIEQAVKKMTPSTIMRHKKEYEDEVIEAICQAAGHLSETRTGALLALEQVIDLDSFCGTGKRLDAKLIPGNCILETIFYKGCPLHDGGVIIRKNRIAAASCVFPLCVDQEVQDKYGMRHQAACGMSEKTDALVLVISEETGDIHVVLDGFLSLAEDTQQLKALLNKYLMNSNERNIPESAKRFEVVWNRVKATFRLLKKNMFTVRTSRKE